MVRIPWNISKCYVVLFICELMDFYFSIFHLNATGLPSHLPVYPQPDFVLICKAFLAELSQFPSLCWYGFLKFASSKIIMIYWKISFKVWKPIFSMHQFCSFDFFYEKVVQILAGKSFVLKLDASKQTISTDIIKLKSIEQWISFRWISPRLPRPRCRANQPHFCSALPVPPAPVLTMQPIWLPSPTSPIRIQLLTCLPQFRLRTLLVAGSRQEAAVRNHRSKFFYHSRNWIIIIIIIISKTNIKLEKWVKYYRF